MISTRTSHIVKIMMTINTAEWRMHKKYNFHNIIIVSYQTILGRRLKCCFYFPSVFTYLPDYSRITYYYTIFYTYWCTACENVSAYCNWTLLVAERITRHRYFESVGIWTLTFWRSITVQLEYLPFCTQLIQTNLFYFYFIAVKQAWWLFVTLFAG